MTTTTTTRRSGPRRASRFAPRPSAYAQGAMAARAGNGLRGMPYGPGGRQDDYVRGYRDERLALAHADDRRAAA